MTALEAPTRSDPPFRGRSILFGFTIVVAFVTAFGAWSNMAPIESAVVAPGIVSVESGLRTVQHLEGGIVQDILVGPGEEVMPDQVLIRLRSTEPLAQLNEVQAQYFEALALEARLTAERDGAGSIAFPDFLTRKIADRAAQAAMENQRAIFENRRSLLAERRTIFERTEDGITSEIGGLEGQIAASEQKLAIVEEELTTTRDLFERQLAPVTRVTALEREQAELKGDISAYRAAIGAAEQRVAEARLRIAELDAVSATEISEELRAAGARIYELGQRIATAQDVVRRTEIRSPIRGVVVDMNVSTIGGVIRAGETLLSVLPQGDAFVVRTTIDPLDIDRVKQGLDATVWLTALNKRSRTGIPGTVSWISADRVNDPATGAGYYQARIEMDPAEVEKSGVPLQAGMGAEVMIATGQRTALDYLAAPIARSFSRAFREE